MYVHAPSCTCAIYGDISNEDFAVLKVILGNQKKACHSEISPYMYPGGVEVNPIPLFVWYLLVLCPLRRSWLLTPSLWTMKALQLPAWESQSWWDGCFNQEASMFIWIRYLNEKETVQEAPAEIVGWNSAAFIQGSELWWSQVRPSRVNF